MSTPDVKIPDLWKMAAMNMLCPKEIQDVLEIQWDEIGEDYAEMRAKVMAWATNRAEKKGGVVPMEIGMVDKRGGEQWHEEGAQEDSGDVDAVFPTTRCYNCGKYGHMANQCSYKGKGMKPAAAAGGKGGGKQGEGKGNWGWGSKGDWRRERGEARLEESSRGGREEEGDQQREEARGMDTKGHAGNAEWWVTSSGSAEWWEQWRSGKMGEMRGARCNQCGL